MRRRLIASAILAAGLFAFPELSTAQTYPTGPVRLIVPFAPGGGSDILGRFTAEALSPYLGQPIVVENKPGAAATIGADYVAKSKPDGYTLLWCPSDSASIAAALKPNLPYKIPEDFTYVAKISDFAYIITVNPKLPLNTLQELIAYAKANPGKLRYGTSGVGGGPHMASALFAKAAGIEMVHVPFNGTAPAITAAMGGHIDVVFGAPSLKPYVDAGSLRALAVTDSKRHPDFPTVPTAAEAGLDVVTTIWWGITAPKDTPEPVLARLRKAVDDMMKDPTLVARMSKTTYLPSYLPHDQFRDFVAKDTAQWKDVAKSANIVLNN